MESMKIKAVHRSVIGKKVGALRRSGQLPAVIYGRKKEPTPIMIEMRESSRILGSLTSSSLVTIEYEGEDLLALVREKQRDYIKGTFLHIDFQVVSMTETIRAFVQVELVGLSPAVKDFNGIVEHHLDEIEVECLPQNLPKKVTVDISSLARIGSQILVKDIQLAGDIKVLNPGEEVIVGITAPKIEAEEVAPVVIEATTEPEVIERGKKEEETPES